MKFSSFDNFCSYKGMENPFKWIKYFDQNFRYVNNPISNSKLVCWPDMLLKVKEGNCLDFAIFTYCIVTYFKCRMLDYDISFSFINILPQFEDKIRKTNDQIVYGHVVPLVKIRSEVYIINYANASEVYNSNKGIDLKSNIYGPYSTYEEAHNRICGTISTSNNKARTKLDRKYSTFQILRDRLLYYDDMIVINYLYNKNISQIELLSQMNGMYEFMKDIFYNYNFINNPPIPNSLIVKKSLGENILKTKLSLNKTIETIRLFKPNK